MEKPWLNKITYEFTQEGNTDGTTEDIEELIVEVESGVGSIVEHGGYMVLKSSTGWSINDIGELTDLLHLINKGVGAAE